MNRRERLLASIIGPEMDETKAKMLDTTIKFILGDMGMQYTKLWALEGPGVMVFQPNIKEQPQAEAYHRLLLKIAVFDKENYLLLQNRYTSKATQHKKRPLYF